MEEIITDEMISTIPLLDDREKRECSFALVYEKYKHGTSGHLSYLLTAKLVRALLSSLRYQQQTQDGFNALNRLWCLMTNDERDMIIKRLDNES